MNPAVLTIYAIHCESEKDKAKNIKVVFLILSASWFYDIASLMLHAGPTVLKSLVLHCRRPQEKPLQ